jgi:hypothetical protein
MITLHDGKPVTSEDVRWTLGEVVPKSLALQYSERLALGITPLMTGVRWLLFPLVSGLSLLATGLLRVLGVARQPSVDRYYTPEELELIVSESEQSGAIKADAGRMLKEIFEQPNAINNCLRGRAEQKEGRIVLGGIADHTRELVRAKRFVLTGQGTAWHAGWWAIT